MEHPANIAVALDVCKQVGVNRSTALKGMHKVQPDAGALVAWNLDIDNKNIRFVNGMAANDPVSTFQIWNFISERFVTDEETTCIFFNSRDDRPVRTRQMIELTFEKIKPDYFFIRGDKVKKIIDTFGKTSLKTSIDIIGLEQPLENVISSLKNLPNNSLVYAIGNQVGAGQEILENIARLKNNG